MSRPFAYIDTSALVKRFVNEARSLDMESFLIAGTHRCALSSLSLTELKTVLRRRQRDPNAAQQITQHTAQQAYSQVLMELAQSTWHFQQVSESIFTYAGELVDQLSTQLGALDALHLACAKTARCSLMVSADKQLLRASAEIGLQTLDLS
jgi:predicted nucleic acid-binding protein